MRTKTWFLCFFLIALMTASAAADQTDKLLESARAAYQSGQYQEGADLYEKAIKQGATRAGVYYNSACCFALIGQKEKAFVNLFRAFEAGYHNCDWIQQDSDLELLRSDQRWDDLVQKCDMTTNAYLETINRELYFMYRRDQDDRLSGKIDWSQVSVRDHERQERVREMLASDMIEAPDDYYHAAMIMQHGDDSTAYALAHELAVKAVEMGSTAGAARWLTAATKDRYLWSVGKPQWYGTQYHQIDGKWTIEPIDTTAVTDEDRRALDVPPLAQARQRVKEMNEQ